jgi:hypothetical protein
MKYLSVIISLLFCSSIFAAQKTIWNSENRKLERDQVDLWKGNLEKSDLMAESERIGFLSQGLRNMGHRKSINDHSTEVDEVYLKIQNAMLLIPGHADYFAKEIQISRAKAIDRQAREGGETRWEHYDDVRSAAIETLQNLPSPEAIRVLGELLSDSEKTGPQITEGALPDAFGPPPNASLAADALKLLIEKPPVPQDRNWQKKGDIEAWQLWYEQIKSGNRTFRFKGDPKDYDLTGPASNDKLQRVERNLKRDDERTAGHTKSSTPVGTETIAASAGRTYAIAGLVTMLALVAAALWYFLRGRRAT